MPSMPRAGYTKPGAAGAMVGCLRVAPLPGLGRADRPDGRGRRWGMRPRHALKRHALRSLAPAALAGSGVRSIRSRRLAARVSYAEIGVGAITRCDYLRRCGPHNPKRWV